MKTDPTTGISVISGWRLLFETVVTAAILTVAAITGGLLWFAISAIQALCMGLALMGYHNKLTLQDRR